MEGRPSEVPLDRIDLTDGRYTLSFDPDSPDIPDALVDSIASCGIVNRARLLDYGGRYIPVAGWRRLLAAEKLGLKTVPALVYGDDLDDAGAVRLALLDNFPAREYTAAEASQVVSRLVVDFGMGEDEVVEEFFDLIGLPRSRKIFSDLLSVGTLSDEIKALCNERRYSLKAMCRWRGFNEEERGELLKLISAVPVGSGVVSEMLLAVSDIVKRDGITVGELIIDPALRSILNDEKTAPGLKGEKVRGRIREIRYPIHSGLTERFDQIVKGMNLPKGAEISHHPHFEADALDLTFRFRGGRDLKRLGESLTDIFDSEEMRELLDMI